MCWQTERNGRYWKRGSVIGWERALPRLRLPGRHVKFLSVMSFYSLWQHYISMTSQPLANSDRGVMRIVGNHRINASSPIVPALSPSLCRSSFAIVSLHPLTPSPLFLLLVATPPPLRVAFYFPFILCCQLLVPHLVRLKTPLPAPLFEILSHFPNPCHNTSLRWLCQDSGMLVPVFMCRLDWTHPERPAGQCDTVSLSLKPTILLLPHVCEYFSPAGCFLQLT